MALDEDDGPLLPRLFARRMEEWRRGAWGEGRFDLPPDDRAEFIPLP